jgi:hypothetical protein
VLEALVSGSFIRRRRLSACNMHSSAIEDAHIVTATAATVRGNLGIGHNSNIIKNNNSGNMGSSNSIATNNAAPQSLTR